VGRGLICAAACALAFVASVPPAHASRHPANVPWESYLPAMEGGGQVQPRGVPFCRKSTVRCIDAQIKRMRSLQGRLGCDHRGVFTTTYLELSRQIRRTFTTRPGFFDDSRYLYTQVAVFANVYFNSVRTWSDGHRVPEAWRIAFEAAQDGDANATQDMLLGINAHVQNDMPYVVASMGLRMRDGRSRKPDHDRGNEILDAGYENVVRAVGDRFDPFLATSNPEWSFADDVLGLELVKEWREGVWRNAERLLAAKDAGERRQVADQIEQNAALWASNIAGPQQPGYRGQRDAYCLAKHRSR
jgi:hypothetical protein